MTKAGKVTGAPRGKRLARHRHIWVRTSKVAELRASAVRAWGAGGTPARQKKAVLVVCDGTASADATKCSRSQQQWCERGGGSRLEVSRLAGRPCSNGHKRRGSECGGWRLDVQHLEDLGLQLVAHDLQTRVGETVVDEWMSGSVEGVAQGGEEVEVWSAHGGSLL